MRSDDNATYLLVHIGYHKTGTTWLQENVFNQASCGFGSPWRRSQITEDWIGPSAFDFDPAATRARYEPGIEKAHREGLVPVLSHERLSGYPASGGYDSKLIADRLAHTFPEARIVIIVREQHSMLRSWYSQYVKDGGSLSLRRFLDPIQPSLVRVPNFSFKFYEYDRLIAYYQRLFSPGHVLVLPLELFRFNPRKFINLLFSFAAVPARDLPLSCLTDKKNTSGTNAAETVLTRVVNRVFNTNQLNPISYVHAPRLEHRIRRLIPKVSEKVPRHDRERIEKNMRRHIDCAVGSRYHKSNQKLSEMIDMNLSSFGY